MVPTSALSIIHPIHPVHLYSSPPPLAQLSSQSLAYNVPGGKLNRGISVVDTLAILLGRPLTDDEYHRAAVLGWCIELLQAFFLVSDDIMDSSITRRGQPCYYRAHGIGMIAINDAFLLEAAIYFLLKKYFRHEDYYIDLVELFLETTHKTEMGQLVDLITAPEDKVDLDKFSLAKCVLFRLFLSSSPPLILAHRHKYIVIYKTAFYSFYLPVALAMLVARIPDSYTLPSHPSPVRPYDLAKSFLIPLGEYFQIQDDFLDYSATPEILGKIGTDIKDNKCSWCVNTALLLATPAQRKVLDENYGRKDDAHEARVKELYEELGLRKVHAEYEEKTGRELQALIEQIPEGGERTLKRAVFTSFFEKIYKRNM